MKKIALGVLVFVLIVVGSGAVFVLTYKPEQRPAPDVDIEADEAMLARGEYLVTHVLGCRECHSERDWTRYTGPITGDPFVGGFCWGPEMNMPGKVCVPNITPHGGAGIGDWTDGEIMRAIREGVDADGKVLFPQMPYESYRALSDDDTMAVVAYLRKIERSDKPDEPSDVDFPVSFFIKLAPKPLDGPVPSPDRDNSKEYGKYLTTVAGCLYCHTPVDDKKAMISGKELSGGQEFVGPWGTVRTANLTPDEKTGLTMSRESFVSLFKAFADPRSKAKVDPRNNTVMPWGTYAGMTDKDLGAMYDYLQSVPAIENEVERRPGTDAAAQQVQ